MRHYRNYFDESLVKTVTILKSGNSTPRSIIRSILQNEKTAKVAPKQHLFRSWIHGKEYDGKQWFKQGGNLPTSQEACRVSTLSMQ